MSEVLKSTVFGSKFTTFDEGSNMANWIFPQNGKSHIKIGQDFVPISILQIQAILYGENKIRYIVEFIECE